MTTATTSIGPNSAAINYSVGATVLEVADAIQAFILTKGWELHDALAGTNARCYRALNADGVSYKYVVIRLTVSYLNVEVYESWNATTHVGLNMAFNSDAATHGQRLSLANSGYVYVFVTARWLALMSKINDGSIGSASGNSFCGCFEISRDNTDEVPGAFPIYAWANGNGLLGSIADTSYPRCFALPRTKQNFTLDAASRDMTVSTLAGSTTRTGVDYTLSSALPTITNPWSLANNNFVFTPFAVQTKASGVANFNVRGRFYGLKILANNLGTPFDLITVKVDADTFYSPTGTDTDHHILPTVNNNRFAIPV